MTTSTTLRQRLRGWPGGVALMIVGGALALGGLLQTTSSHYDTSTDCPTGSTLVSKYNRVGNSYVFEKPAGNASVVTISSGSDSGGAWTATRPITAVILKGGPNSVVTSLSPPQTSGAFSNHWLPKVGNGQNYPDVSNVQFCGSNVATTTTTTRPPTTTTRPPTTTTRPPTTTTRPPTTTTRPPTTTTRPPTTTTRPPTTTTAAPTTTTRPPTTTTAAPTTTTTRPPTTTTRPPTTTTNQYVTTEPPETTTTTRPATTTTAPGATTTTTRPGATTTTTRPGSTTTVVQVSGEELTQSTSPVTTSTTIVSNDVMGESLPRTGASSGPLIGIGLALLLAGAAMTIVAVRRDRA